MTRYVAFLRAINVGGRSVKKEQLVEAFSSIGLDDVSTLKQSGNVIFISEGIGEKELEHRIETELSRRLGYDVPTFVRSMDELEALFSQSPFKEASEGTSQLVTFFADEQKGMGMRYPLTVPGSTALIIAIKGREAYSETHGGGEGGMPNPYLERLLKVKATTRNINIIAEILDKCR